MSNPTPRAGRILLVDDDDALRDALADLLESRGYDVVAVDDGQRGLEQCQRDSFDLVVTDFRMPGLGGMQLLKELRESDPKMPVIMMTAFGTADSAIEATRVGAFDYLVKPFPMETFLDLTEKAVAVGRLSAKPISLGRETPDKDAIVGTSRVMQEVFKEIGRIAGKPVTVLIKGETGSGKELVARALYQHGGREDQPFIAVNCAAIPENLIESELFGHERGAFTGAQAQRIGRFEQAHGGTLFLDEVGDLPAPTQVKLLRVLQERTVTRVGGKTAIPIDVRVIAATHRDLESMVAERTFREDLFYRINTTFIHLPALRQRAEDIPELVDYFVARHSAEFGIECPAIQKKSLALLNAHPWPGNVRQLQNVIRRLLVAANGFPITRALVEQCLDQDVASSVGYPNDEGAPSEKETVKGMVAKSLQAAWAGKLPDGAYGVLVARLEEELYRQAIALSQGNQSTVSKWLGVSRLTVREKLDRYDLYPKRQATNTGSEPAN